MDAAVVATGTILFKPDPGWQWNGWNGKAKFGCRDQGFLIGGNPVALDTDLEQMFQVLLGKQYTAPPYKDIPGTTIVASIRIDASTLCPIWQGAGRKVVTQATCGKFQIQVTPAYLVGNSAYPDTVITKLGKFEIADSGQPLVNC